MAANVEPEPKLEIAHILTMDAVAYSTLLISEQSRLMKELIQCVRGTPRFRQAEAEGKLIRIPTGDGMALVFFNDPEAPIECAMQISAELKSHPEIRLRMGIHSGPINQVLDVNDRSNVAGAGIDMAQRVMDCGDAGHILLSERVAADLAPYPRWNGHLHKLGECEVKHGRRVSLVNFYTDEIGNPAVPAKLQYTLDSTNALAAKRRRRKFLLFGALGLAASFIAGFFLLRSSPHENVRHSIAVLPFLDLSSEKNQEYFADGITEQIINSLAHVHGLFVVARTTAFSFKNKNMDVREVGQQLGVSHMLEGSVSHGPGKVRVVAQLINVATGYHVWSETYDSTEKDLLLLQSDVATKVANALQIELQLAEVTQLAKPLTQDPEAYDLYLRGRYLLNKRTVDSIQKALALFQEAVTKDAQFALGRAGVADAYILLGKIGAMPGQEAAARAWPEVSSALAIDPELADGYVSRAILLTDFEWNWPAAEVDFQKALALNPNSAAGHHWYARHLEELGRSEEALREIAAALKNDPLSPTIWVAKGNILFVAHRYQEAIDCCKKALELEQDFASAYQVLGQAYAHLGEHGKAIDAAKKYVELSEGTGWSMLELAYSYAIAGNRAESDRIVNEVTARRGGFSPYDMATIHSAWRDAAGAMPWLERAIDQRSVDVI
jgi:TolB-like protein/Tfp pilus assembly protein PilF